MNILNPEQYNAVTNTDPRLLILAGAGTGKTHTMIYKAAYIAENLFPAENILMLTFTNKAAHEMVSRLEKLNINGVTACTFHSFCAAELRKYANLLGVDNNFSILTPSDTEEVIKMFREKDCPLSVKEIVSIDSYAENKCISLKEAVRKLLDADLGEGLPLPEIEKVISQARNYRLTHSMLSYDDLQTLFVEALETTGIKIKLRHKYRFVMVDEYQDTNTIQDKILDLMDPEYLAVVGDDCQSLYAFRGAEVENIIRFPEKHDATVIKLERNYRSNQQILDLTNQMMQDYNTEGLSKWLTAESDIGEAPILKRPLNVAEEAEYVFAYIKRWLELGNEPNELCVLVRAASATFYLETLLNHEGIPFTKRGGPKFFESSVIKDVMSIFEISHNRKNRIAWFRALMIIRNIGRVNALKISEALGAGLGIEKFSKRKYYKDIKRLIDVATAKSEWHERLKSICDYYIKVSLENIDMSNSKYKGSAKEAFLTVASTYLDVLMKMAKDYTSEEEFIDALMTENTVDEEENNIIISTIHSAKGLEFDFVILMGASEKIFPREYTPEELRCMYVALTRPRYFLLVTSPVIYQTRYSCLKTPLPKWLNYPTLLDPK